MRFISPTWIASLSFGFLATSASADSLKNCNSQNIDRIVSGCTSVLREGKLDRKNKAIVFALRGDAYFRMGNPDAAFADFRACLELTPQDKICSEGLATVRCYKTLYVLQDPDAAETQCAYLRNSKNQNEQAKYYNSIGLAYFGRYKFGSGSADPNLGKAIAAMSEGIAINSKIGKVEAENYATRGLAYLQNTKPGEKVFSQDADKALQDFNMAISLTPNIASNYLHRGYAHNQLLNGDAAWADFKKAKELDPSDPAIQDAYEKQRRVFSPEGREEVLKQLEAIGANAKAESVAFDYGPNAFTCTATINNILKDPEGSTTLVVELKNGCGIEPITVSSALPSECVIGKRVTARGTLIDEEALFLVAQRLVDVTDIKCQ